MIVFYFYLHCSHTQYNFCSKSYLLILVYNNLFFFLLKKISNITIYSVFDCFIFFFHSKRIYYTFNSFIFFFFSLERFFASLIILSSPFYLFQAVFSFLSSFRRVLLTCKILFNFIFSVFFCTICSIVIIK